jgi:uncharacterized protein YcbX
MTSVHIPALRIAALWTYPVKSCAGVSLPQATLTDKGLDHDRAWMVVDAEGEMLTQRELPRMALIQPHLHASTGDSYALTLQAPGMAPVTVAPADHATTASRVRVWNDEVPAFDAGEAVGHWLTRFLCPQAQPGVPGPLRLVRFDDHHARPSSATWTQGHTALNRFSDGFALLVVSQASLDELNHRLAQQGQPAVDMRRFRPNIVIDGDAWQAHDEDRLQRVCVQTDKGEAVLLPVKPCPRCPIPDIDPDTAVAGAVIGPLLQTYRQDARVNGAITFGMNALVLQGVGHRLQVGQTVEAPWDF